MVDAFQLQSTASVTNKRFILRILKAEKQDFPSIIKFVSPYEPTCVQLCSYLRKNSEHIYILQSENGDTLGILYNDSTVFHCIPQQNLPQLDKSQLLNFLYSSQKRIKCISGESTGTGFIVNLLQTKVSAPYQTNHYNLMTATAITNPPDTLCNDDQIIHCTENNLDSLLPLQKMYVQQEVAPAGREVSDAEVSLSLRQLLKTQLCVALSTDDELVAKANTNAIGFNWIQLGGIFTHPLYRRNGYAWQLISAICRRTTAAGKSTALFVKDINIPAIELYKKLGFKKTATFTIAYFE